MQFCNDKFWDTEKAWNSSDPDLTACFQDTALVYVPCIFLWCVAPFLLWSARPKPDSSVGWTIPAIVKIVIATFLILLCLADSIYLGYRSSEIDRHHSVAKVVADIVKIVTFALSMSLVYVDRVKGRASNGYQFTFWLLLVVTGTVQFRTYLKQALEGVIPDQCVFGFQIIYYPLIVLEFVMFCFVDTEAGVSAKFPEHSWPEQRSSFPSRLLFSWFTGLVYRGWKRPLTMENLWVMDTEDQTQHTVERFNENWQAEIEQSLKKSKPPSLARALGRTHRDLMIFAGILQLLSTVILQTVVLPFALRYIIWFVSQPNEYRWKGYFISCMLFLISAAFSILLAQFYHVGAVISMRTRSALMGAIYRKALRISTFAKQEKGSAQILSLMTVDTQRFGLTPIHVHSIWGGVLQLVIAVYLLYQLIGPSVFAGIGAMLLTIPLVGVVMRKNRVVENEQLKEKDNRLKIMSEILSGMKILKLYAWEEIFEDKITAIRNREIASLHRSAHLKAINMITWLFTPSLIAVASFTTFVLSDPANVLTPTVTFVSLALFGILRVPLALLPAAITGLIQAKLSLNRISTFLLSEEVDQSSVERLPTDSDQSSCAISVENGSFSWNDDGKALPVLRNLDLRILPSEFVAVVGPVGGGKSSLCTALLGLIHKLDGKVVIKGSVAYCSQSAWIQNLTVRDNILFGLPYDDDRYQAVIEATALQPDLEILPDGDGTLIGERGINLSGGQKHRINIARAVYSDADVYILDDPLSAVDSHVAQHIFEHVIGPTGLLREKTRLLVTNGVSQLSATDKILFMRDGQLSAFASLQEVLKVDEFREFHQELRHRPKTTPEKETVDKEWLQRSTDDDIAPELDDGIVGKKDTKMPTVRKESIEREINGEATKLIEDEKTETGKVSWSVYKVLLQYASYGGVFFAILTNAIYTAFVLFANIWLSLWSEENQRLLQGTSWTANGTVDNEFSPDDRRGYWLGIYVLFNVFQAISIYSSALVLSLICIVASRRIHSEMLHRLMRAPMVFFETTPVGRILNRFSRDLDNLDNQLPLHFKMWINGFFILVSVLILICISTPLFIAVVPFIALFYTIIQKLFIPSSRQIKRLEAVTRSPILSHFQESLGGRPVIFAMDQVARFVEANDRLNDIHNMASYANAAGQRWLLVRVEALASVCTFFAALFAVIGKDQWAILHPGLLGLAVTYATTMSSSFSWMVQRSSEIEANVVSVERMQEYTEIEQEAPWETKSESVAVPDNWPTAGQIDFDGYGLRYRGSRDLVLQDISCTIRPGERVGVCGRTGAGKTSLISALFRLVEASTGVIRIDQLDISSVGLHAVRKLITIIPQDPVLFNGTLRDNLDPFHEYTDADIWHSLEMTHLKNYVRNHALGILMEIVEGGENLSVGQRQLACLARALLRKSRILILDEATASVDMESDALIQQTIRGEFAQCTVITVAHKLSTIIDSDRIMVLDAGRLCEFDTPTSLLRNPRSLFHSLARSANLVT